jgi:sporulation protein YlmC with PRC-barrel domain
MKTPKTLLTAGAITAFSLGLAFGAEQSQDQHALGAQQSPESQTMEQQSLTQDPQREYGSPEATRATEKHASISAHKASDLKGSRVQSSDGERLGTVDDLAINLQDGEVSYIIVSSGGFLGIGGDLHPVPPEAVQVRQVDNGLELVLKVTEQQWENAPTVERDQIAQLGEQTHGQQIHQFYGQEYGQRQQGQIQFGAPDEERPRIQTPPSPQADEADPLGTQPAPQSQQQERQQQEVQEFGSTEHRETQQSAQANSQQPGIAGAQQPGLAQQESERAEVGATERDTQTRVEIEQSEQPQYGAAQRDTQAEQTEEEDRTVFGARDRQAVGQAQTGGGQVRLASDLMDTDVTNAQQQTLGKISDILVNLDDGSISFVLLEPDTGFWETADETYAIAPQAFQVADEDRITLNITKQDLEQAQALNQQNLQQHAQQSRMAGAQAQQQPQVFRYQDDDEGRTRGVFGRPDRERDQERDDTMSPQDRARAQDRQQQETTPGTSPSPEPGTTW